MKLRKLFFAYLYGLFFHCLFAFDYDVRDVKSLEYLRFLHVHEQGADESCGLSVVSSILNLYLNHDVSEIDLVSELSEELQISRRLTMAHMMKIFESYGYETKAYKIDIENFIKAVQKYAPVIVHYDKPELHFVFVLKACQNYVVVADPVLGVEMQTMEDFQKKWSKTILLIQMPEDTLNKTMIKSAIETAIQKHSLLERVAKRKW